MVKLTTNQTHLGRSVAKKESSRHPSLHNVGNGGEDEIVQAISERCPLARLRLSRNNVQSIRRPVREIDIFCDCRCEDKLIRGFLLPAVGFLPSLSMTEVCPWGIFSFNFVKCWLKEDQIVTRLLSSGGRRLMQCGIERNAEWKRS